MLMNDSYLFDLGWLFFAVWIAVVAVVTLTAFGRELTPSAAREAQEGSGTGQSAEPGGNLRG